MNREPINPDLAILGQNINQIIMQKGISISQCAAELGYDRQDLSEIITGQKNITLKTAEKLARYFDFSLCLLFSRNFSNLEYRVHFRFVEADYIGVVAGNFFASSIPQSQVPLDPSTVSKVLHGKNNNPTIKTLSIIATSSKKTLSELLYTSTDKETITKIMMEE